MEPRRRRDLLEQGIELFNQGEFFECHEVLEEVWKDAHGDDKRFYQGLIQAAVAILHALRGNRDGARKQYAKARAKLDVAPAEHMGLAVRELREDLARFFDAALSDEGGALPPPPKLQRAGR
jgi:uncharacterized protein